VKHYDSQEILMGRLLNFPKDAVIAFNAGVRREDWETEDLRDCWDAIRSNARQGGTHDLVSICERVDDQASKNVILELFDLETRRWDTVTNILWHLEKALGRPFYA
jgi:hypothetical protein